MKSKSLLTSLILIAVVAIGGYYFSANKPQATVQGLPQVVALFETSLASPISANATSMTLTANAVRGGTALSGYNCFSVDEGSAQAEFICGIVAGTAVTSLSRGIDPANGTSTTATLQFAHRRGASVKITDFPTITIMRNQLSGVEFLSSTSPMRYDSAFTPSVGSYVVATWDYIKTYADGLVAAGVATSSETNFGGVWLGTALQQASSTNGGANKPYVMQTRYATDTPTSGCAVGYTGTPGAGCSVIATLGGKIRQTFLDIFSTVNTWTGANTFNATTTVATTTHSGVALGIKPGDNTMLGAEAITAGNAVSSYFYQSDGGVQYDTSILNSGTANSFSQNITVGNNANRMIVVSIMIPQDTVNTPQVGGQNMKLINSRALTATGYLNSYYYIAPSTGVQSVTGSFSGGAIPYSVSIFSFYNVNQTVQYNASSTSSVSDSTTGSISITPPQGGTLLFGYFGSRDPGNCTTPSALVGANNNLLSLDGLNVCSLAGYSYIDPSATLQTVSFSGATHNGGALGIFTIPPAISPSYGYVAKASAQNGPSYSTPLATSTRINFLGFALTNSSSLGTSTIQTQGIVTGLSGLLPNKTYFLSDTPGAISATPGTIRRVIGTAITTTSLLITNSPTW